jgi:murein L,D-transpeptidase YcbB/YkuD
MSRLCIAMIALLAGVAVPQPLLAQAASIAPAQPLSSPASDADAALDPFYTSRNQAPVWLKDDAGRTAAQAFANVLRGAAIDGLPQGPALASQVDAAIARGQPADDRIISSAWIRYVSALNGPVQGINFGDPTLALKPPSSALILARLAAAPSLGDLVAQTAAVNPLYAALRDAAVKGGDADDPHVKATLDRLRLIPAKGRAILVDAANAELWMLEDGRPVDSMKVVVGKVISPTPLLAGKIHYVTFNPYWHIPDDVARKRVAPVVIKRGVSYLKAARYVTSETYSAESAAVDPATIDWKGVAAGTTPVYLRQLPGGQNMMGAMKFSFDNDQDIFLHDTPKDKLHQALFAKDKRNYSMGCIRLEHADRLARWLLGRDPTAPNADPEQHVQVDGGVPVYVSYLTANVVDGKLVFADDAYKLDPVPTASASIAAASAAKSN